MNKETIKNLDLPSIKDNQLNFVLASTIKATALSLLAACASDIQSDFVNECDDPAVLHQYAVSASTPLLELPICVHYVFADQRNYAASWYASIAEPNYIDEKFDDINMELEGVYGNETFDDDSRIRLVSVQEPKVIINPEWSALFGSDEKAEMYRVAAEMKRANNNYDCVNYYMINNSVTLNGALPLGFADMPGSPEKGGIVIRAGVLNAEVHELGHILGLWHTHETKFGSSVENRGEPYLTGDLLKDTPPDPGQAEWDPASGEFTAGCSLDAEYDYETQQFDDQFMVCDEEFANIEDAVPYTNRMSYYPYHGFQTFTDEQRQRMHCTWDRHQADIIGL